MIDPGQAIVGIIVVLVAVGALLYVFYSRTNAVEKSGYGALIMLSVISLMIPVFWILEGNQEAVAQSQQHMIAVQRGAQLYAQYCYQCHGTRGQGLIGPQLNGNSAVNQLSDADLIRIISAGIYGSDMPTWSQQYGGPLTDNDIQYLFALIRSSDPAYLAKNGYTGDSAINGFTLVQSNILPSAYQTAVAKETTVTFATPVDLTNKKAITIEIAAPLPGATCAPACFELPGVNINGLLNIKIKVGTVITWVNKDVVPHTVSAVQGTKVVVGPQKIASQIFDSGLVPGIRTGQTFTYTVTTAAYNFNPNHTVIYYCQYHASMLAELTIVP